MALTPKSAADAKAAEDKAAEETKADAKEEKPKQYAAVDGSMKVKAIVDAPKEAGAEPSVPSGTMPYPITEKTGMPAVGWSWSGDKYYPPAP